MIDRLRGEFAGRAELTPVLWEHQPLAASESFQEQISEPADSDIAIFILWARLGTRLPEHITRPDGSRYDSGTEYEFENAITACQATGKPRILTYRKGARQQVDLADEEALLARLAQKKALDEFEKRWFHSARGTSITAAYHPFMAPAEFESLLEKHLRKLVMELLPQAEAETAEAAAFWRQGSPFRGLAAFDFEHAAVFFGRTQAVADVVQALRRQAADDRAFVLVVGASGGGKSSLARAGVLPMLVRPGVVDGVDLWRRAVFRPGDAGADPFASLAAALLRPEALPELGLEVDGPTALAELLRDEPRGTAARVARALDAAGAEARPEGDRSHPFKARLALVVDQMEELFTLDGVGAEERQGLTTVLDACARSGRIWVIATLRSDFYSRCGELETLAELIKGSGHVDLRPPTPTQIGRMIRLPARAAGLRFEEDDAGTGLDDRLQDATAADPQALPLLEFTLEQLYQRRDPSGLLTHAAYREIGGLEGSLAKRAEQVFGGLSPGAREALPSVLRHLVAVGRERDEPIHRRAAPLEALTATADARELVEAFVEARLFVTERSEDGGGTVSLAHEALLRHWPRLVAWLDEDRETLRAQARLSSAAARWEREGRTPDFLLQPGKPLAEAEELAGRPELELAEVERALVRESGARRARARRLRRAVTAALALLAVVAATTAWFATSARREAERRRGQAEGLIGFMVGDLRKKLEPIGRLEVLDGVGDAALEYFASVPASDLTDEELVRRAEALDLIGQVRRSEGDLPAAMEAFEQSLRAFEGLVARQPANGQWLAGLGAARFWIGYTFYDQRRYDAALEQFRAYLEIAHRLVALEPNNDAWHLEVAYAQSTIGSVLEAQGELEAALEAYRQNLAVKERLVAKEPENTDWRLELAVQHNLIGFVLWQLGDLSGARAHLETELGIAQALVQRDGRNTAWRSRLAVSHDYLGRLTRALGDETAASAHLRAGLEIIRQLASADPRNAIWQRHLAVTRIAQVQLLLDRGDLGSAQREIAASLGELESLVAENPDQTAWRTDLAAAHRVRGLVLEARGRGGEAHKATDRAIELLAPLAAADATDAPAHRELGEAYLLLGRLLAVAGEEEAARNAWARTLEVIGPLAEGSRDPRLLDPWARALARLGRLDEAGAIVERLRDAGYAEASFLEAVGTDRRVAGSTTGAGAP